MSTKSRSLLFYKNTFANILFFIFNSLLGLIVVPLFIKNMGSDLYGIWILNFAIMNYFLFLNSSFSGGVIKNISETMSSRNISKQIATINVSLVLYLIVGIFIFVFFALSVDYIISFFKVDAKQYELLRQMLLISATFAIILWPLKVFEAVFLGLLEHTTLNIIKGIASIVTTISIIVMLNYNIDLKNILIVFYILSMSVGILLFIFYYKKHREYRFKISDFNKQTISPILGFSLKLMVLEIISMFSFQVDTFVIAYFLPISYVATYAIITKLFYLFQGVYGVILGVVQPMIFDAAHKDDKAFIRKMALKGFKYILIFYIPLIVVAAIFAEPFIYLWVGEEYGQYAIWASVFLLQYLISPAVGVLGTISIGMSKLKYIQIYGIFSALSNLILSIIFVKMYGFHGVILGTVITTFFGVMIIYPYYCKAIELDWKIPIKENYREFISLLFFLTIGFIFNNYFSVNSWSMLIFSSIVILIIIYLWMFLIFGYKEEKEKLYKLIKTRRF